MSGINLRTKQGWEDLKRILDDRPFDVLDICGIDPPKPGARRLDIDDPRGGGKNNFAIWLYADGLSWKHFAGTEKGKSLELIAYCHGWWHLENHGAEEAAKLAVDRLGLGRVNAAELEADRAKAAARRERAREDIDAERERRAKAAFALWLNAEPILGRQGRGTLAEKYLKARGIDLRAAPFVGPRGGAIAPHCLRFVASHKYVIRNRDGSKCGESWHPCMVTACVNADMRVVAVHQTWLNADGTDKATIRRGDDGTPQKPRKVFGDSAGCVIPLWPGEGQFSVKRALEEHELHGLCQTIVHTEGVEDGLSAVLAKPQHRVWPALSLSNLANVAERLPRFCDAVLIHQQNDWAKPEAVKAFEDAIIAHQRTGRAVGIVEALIGKDLNDTLRGAA